MAKATAAARAPLPGSASVCDVFMVTLGKATAAARPIATSVRYVSWVRLQHLQDLLLPVYAMFHGLGYSSCQTYCYQCTLCFMGKATELHDPLLPVYAMFHG